MKETIDKRNRPLNAGRILSIVLQVEAAGLIFLPLAHIFVKKNLSEFYDSVGMPFPPLTALAHSPTGICVSIGFGVALLLLTNRLSKTGKKIVAVLLSIFCFIIIFLEALAIYLPYLKLSLQL